ncbi:RNA polymerase sigma factor [Chitinophaga arvensicola]|uniref:RNA polymerase sigma-70 factor, ECF subfamily n=1 Tax=Chitinophaga arvensicola TaxID=29529 RepID=A0A1I0RRY7_9BACT|nr:sigma-70 family RNA polymerase sigma factor [Chitinophaga arvensicola]SEW43973.1 RNA polymerase sigma-70 factor, ECF subfamily [Chitinophaga arvensicola]
MEKHSDSRLLQMIREDHHPAFTTLVNRYWEEIYRFTRSRIRQEADAQDIVQEIFISCWNNRKHLYAGKNDQFTAYLYQAARYAVIDYYSRSQTMVYNEVLLESFIGHQPVNMTESRLQLKELDACIRQEVDRLPEQLRVPFVLSREANMSLKEIATQLSLSEQTIKNNITKALGILRRRLHQQDIYLLMAGLPLYHKFIIP